MDQTTSYSFDGESFFPKIMYDLICGVRAADPIAAYKATQTRQPRKVLAPEGSLLLASGDEASVGEPQACESRHRYLARLLRIMVGGMFDGVVAPPDVLEELCLCQQIIRECGGNSFLDGKVVIATMNAGPDSAAFSAFTVERAKLLHCDGVWVRASVPRTGDKAGAALERIADAVAHANTEQVPAFIEPRWADAPGPADWSVDSTAELLGIISAVGETSTRTWLALPGFPGLAKALEAVTLPTVLTSITGSEGDLSALLEGVASVPGESGNIRGMALGGKSIPPGDDPLAVAGAIQAIMRKSADPSTIIERMDQARDRGIDVLSSLVKDADTLEFGGGSATASYV